MDIAQVKENIPHSADSLTAVLPSKMATNQTPRLPLTDLKQVARPCSNQKRKSRSSFPLNTPNGKKTIRKIQPATLVYEEEKENLHTEAVHGDIATLDSGLKETQDERLDEFVTCVLNKCVKDVTANSTSITKMEKEADLGNNSKTDLCTENTIIEHVPVTCNENSDTPHETSHSPKQDREMPEQLETSNVNHNAKKHVTFDSSILTEEILLANTSSDSVCSDNTSDSTKSEEELLASFTEAPHIGSTAAPAESLTPELKNAMFTVKTPKVNFLEQLALTQRVKRATKSIGGFIVHKEDMLPELKLTWTQGESVAVTKQSYDGDDVAHKTEVLDKSMNTEAFTPERKASHSVSCSPLALIQHDVGTQNAAEVNSVFCSPMPNSCNDASTQKETETQSTLCSPIRIPGLETSVQAVVETRSVMCTPIRVPVMDSSTQNVAETQSTSCSPMLVPVMEASTQNEVETQSIMCSPMVPCPSQDKSILVSGPDLVDLCIGTDTVDMKDEEVSVQPDTTTSSTTMEDYPMVSCGTVMTPLKIAHKQGKRLTADDIRKQHPRVLANELDTLRAQNERLESRIHSLQQDTKKLASYEELVTDLQDTRGMLEEERDMYWSQYGEWKSKSEGLEKENEMLRTSHSKEISELKESYETHDYQSHFLSSQKLVMELQGELLEYKELLPDLEQSQKLMTALKSQYSDSFMKLKRANEKLQERKTELDVKETEVTRLKSECDVIQEENRSIETKRQEMAESVSALKTRLSQMEEELQTKNEAIQKLDESNERVQSQTNIIINLERTLDNRDKEIDMLEKDLFECREVICKQMDERNASEAQISSQSAELKNVKSENDGLKDCLARLRAKEQEARDGWTSVQEELTRTKEHASRIIKQQGTEIADCSQSIDQFTDHMTTVLAELKKRAGLQDEKSSSETNKTTSTEKESVPKSKWASKKSFVSQILLAVKTADTEDSAKQGTSADTDRETKTTDNTTSPNEELASASGNSNKTRSQTDLLASEKEKVDSQGSISQTNIEVSCNSAFAPVKLAESLVQPKIGDIDKHVTRRSNQMQPKKSNVVSTSSVTKISISSKDNKCNDVGNVPSAVTDEENKLSDQTRRITDMFTQVIHVASLIEKALRSSLQDMRSDDIKLRSNVSQCEYSEKRARAQLEVVQAELETSRKMVKQKQTLIDEQSAWLEGMLDAQSEAEKQDREREIRLLRSKIQSLEGEKDIMNEQFNELLHKVQSHSVEKSTNVDVDAHKEIVLLKKKAHKYRLSMLDKEELIVNEQSKANQRVHAMEENWKKADAEVMRLCERIDRIRSALVVSKKFTEDPDLQKVIEIADGRDKDSGSILKPMKTSRW